MGKQPDKDTVIPAIIFLLLVIVAIVLVALRVYAYVAYATTPVGELPAWVYWFTK